MRLVWTSHLNLPSPLAGACLHPSIALAHSFLRGCIIGEHLLSLLFPHSVPVLCLFPGRVFSLSRDRIGYFHTYISSHSFISVLYFFIPSLHPFSTVLQLNDGYQTYNLGIHWIHCTQYDSSPSWVAHSQVPTSSTAPRTSQVSCVERDDQ